jgi:2-polyprenyl-3-methyl-5-hydroxy-6-metoxy-1,4-benzoquinol methylase
MKNYSADTTKDHFAELTKKMYDRERAYRGVDLFRVRKAVRLVGKGKKVLDLGCYYGFLGEQFIKRGNEVWGVDIAREALKKAAARGLQTKYADVEKEIPFGDGSFDVVAATEIIEHLKDTDRFLEEIHRVLKPDGSLVLTTSNFLSLGRRIFYLLGKNAYHEASFTFPPHPAGHLRYFSKDLLLHFLRFHHFEVVRFESDVVNFTPNPNSRLHSTLLAEVFPTLGRSLIVKARKSEVLGGVTP